MRFLFTIILVLITHCAYASDQPIRAGLYLEAFRKEFPNAVSSLGKQLTIKKILCGENDTAMCAFYADQGVMYAAHKDDATDAITYMFFAGPAGADSLLVLNMFGVATALSNPSLTKGQIGQHLQSLYSQAQKNKGTASVTIDGIFYTMSFTKDALLYDLKRE